MKRLLSIALTAGLTLTASTVSAAVTHIVRIEGPGFFPDTVYYQQGDTIQFQNYASYNARVHIKTTGYSSITCSSSTTNWVTNSIAKYGGTATMSLNSTSTIKLEGPCMITGSSYFGGLSYGQYSYNYDLEIIHGIAPTQ